ncbi:MULTISPECIES: hypothetical protein [Bacillaceae]|uniref:WYL domain-containing protein n=1 Tax=Metabacillus sediminis TaxID=3117746 RepID=A0ABZ2NLZ6_9BACI|nr:hypothetical protein [Bacillus sp. SJS]KZZ85227.1 hypothetical protein AS29_006500 [Bacillus sp. SJS]
MGYLFRESMDHQKPIQVIYLSKKGEISQRNIIIMKKTATSIIARCLLRGKMRTFRVDQILAASFTSSDYSS